MSLAWSDKPKSQPRLYTLFGGLADDVGETVLIPDVPQVTALRAFRDARDYLQSHGFHVRERQDPCDNLPYMIVRNPITGLDEAEYWLRETG